MLSLGISIESGKLEDPYYEPDEKYIKLTKGIDKASGAAYAQVEFKNGVPISLNGKAWAGCAHPEARKIAATQGRQK